MIDRKLFATAQAKAIAYANCNKLEACAAWVQVWLKEIDPQGKLSRIKPALHRQDEINMLVEAGHWPRLEKDVIDEVEDDEEEVTNAA